MCSEPLIKDVYLSAFEHFAREIFGVDSAGDGIVAFKAQLSKIGVPVSLKALD